MLVTTVCKISDIVDCVCSVGKYDVGASCGSLTLFWSIHVMAMSR